MTKSDFLKLCAAYQAEFGPYVPYGCNVPEASFCRSEESGGVSGGSCWDDSDPQPYSVTIEDPGIGKAIDGFLEKYFPSIPFLTYRALMSRVVSSGYTDYEYYGNHTDYQIWSLTFEDVWEVLQEAIERLPDSVLMDIDRNARR
jgi:hypothetical protein